MEQTRACRKCGKVYPLNRSNFGSQPNGNLRYTCRQCVRRNVSRHYYANPQATKNRTEQRRGTLFTTAEKLQIEAQLAKRDGWTCFYCQSYFERLHIDHKVPVSRRGKHELENFALACMQCNQEKHNKTIDEYREWRRLRGLEVTF